VARARRGRGAGPRFFARLRRAAGLLLSREVAVLMNAIAFNVLLCLFPILLVLVAATQRLSPRGGTAQVLGLLLAIAASWPLPGRVWGVDEWIILLFLFLAFIYSHLSKM